ncbi:MAG: glycosyltransferase family 2 protein [Microthrixaceae bacterium]
MGAVTSGGSPGCGVPEMSVVMPVHNEARVLADVVDGLIHHVLDRPLECELVVVDDRSTDGSPSILAAAARGDARITVLRNARRLGHGASVRRGIDESTGRWVLLVDSDGQVDPADFGLLWDRADSNDLVLGVRTGRSDPRHRLVLTRATQGLASLCAGHLVPDPNTPFRLVRRTLLERLAVPEQAFAPAVLVTVGAYRSGARVARVPVRHLARPFGRSSLRPRALTKAAITSAAQTVAYSLRRIEPYER